MKIEQSKFELALAKARLTKAGLAGKAGISAATITKLLAGNNSTPITVGKIAAALGVDVSEIVEMGD